MALVVVVAMPACIKPPKIEFPDVDPKPLRSRILAADGTELARLFVENREPASLSDVPKHVQDAVIAAEDQRYWKHEGFDPKAIGRAAVANVGAKRTVQGGSTITQQFVKNVYFPVERPRTFTQKVKEAELAWKLEKEESKEKILEMYLNTVYFGDGTYGIRTASEQFFRKDVSALNLQEGALLAGLIRSPETYNPRFAHDKALRRRNHVLGRMVALEMISQKEGEDAKAAPIGITEPPIRPSREPYYVDYVKKFVLSNSQFGEDEAERAAFLYQAGVDIETSLDLRLQQYARDAIAGVLNRPGDPSAALVAIDPKTGSVVAMIGGRDYSASQVNLALGREGGGTGRQPGSAFKPFVLATAYEDGMTAGTTFSSVPPVVKLPGEKVPWRPQNSEGKGSGPTALSEAMVHSINAVFVRATLDLGAARVAGMARRMGIVCPLKPVASIALGTLEVSALEMASAYSTLANYGVHLAPSPIEKIVDSDGDEIKVNRPITRALDPGIAFLVTNVLQEVIQRGTGTRAQIGRPAAGKTGTTNNYVDAWFVGYTPDLVTAVWVGHSEGAIPMHNVHGGRVFGGTLPAMIWQRFMSRALADRPAMDFELPRSELITVDIDPATGLLAGPYCSGRQTVTMLRQLAPRRTCASPPPQPAPPAPPPTSTATTTATATTAPETSPSPQPPQESQPAPSPASG